AALVCDDAHVFVACTDGHVYRGELDGEELTTTGRPFSGPPAALALTRDEGLAVAVGHQIHIVARDTGAHRQTLTLEERATVMTADASGQWLVVGTDRGTIAVFDGEEDPSSFTASASAKLHEGKVTALLFESEELRVFSTASDTRLLVTHVRGELEPEDRGGSGMHEQVVESMILGLEDRFYTAGADRSLKSWPAGRTMRRPTTQREQVGRAVAMTLVRRDDKMHVACANQDGTIRVFELDEEGKIAECALTFHDAFAWAQHEFEAKDPARREKALKRLAAFHDAKSLELIAGRVTQDKDHKLKVAAVKLLGEAGNPKAIKHLEGLLSANPEEVRREALTGLRRLEGFEKLRPLELALLTRKEDVSRDAVAALAQLAKHDEAALDALIGALEHSGPTVRSAALYELESYYGAKSPEAHLRAIQSSQKDIRQLAIVRMFQRKLLGDARVEAAVRRLAEDRNASVRLHAFLVSVLRRPKLAKALRGRDDVLNRQLFDVEMFGKPTKKGEEREPPEVAEVSPDTLSDADYEPLLEAMASRSMDTCMKGARGLAQLQDPRAFGTLLQLSRESNVQARVEVCKALEALDDPRALKRLRMMLRDASAPVRDAAFSAVVVLEGEDWLAAAKSGLSAGHEDVRRRGLQVLTSKLRRQDSPDAQGLALLGQTLHDSAQPVRSEALKATLGMQVGGSVESALRFGNESIHADVRLDVLVELMGQFQGDWAWAMIMEFYEDPSEDLREEAFNFALKRAKRERRSTSLTSALASSYADVRLMGVKELTERRLDDVEDLIVEALDDEDETVRRTAVAALVKAGAHELLRRAMGSKHDDVKVRAASAVANLGDPSAMDVLVALATREEPDADRKSEHAQWFDHVLRALEGIAELGEASAREAIEALIDHEHSAIRQAAVRALVWTSRPETLDTLRRVVRHSDEAVQREAALGLAYYGDRLGASMVFHSSVSAQEQLYAALGLIEDDEDQFFAFLDHDTRAIRREAFLLLLLRELGERDGVPDKCLAALSSAPPEVRLDAAGALEAFANTEDLEEYVVNAVNTFHGGKIAWDIEVGVVRKLSIAVTRGGAQVRVRAARLLQQLRQEQQEEFERQWAIYAKRYQNELERLTAEASEQDGAQELGSEGKIQRAWRSLTAAVRKLTGAGEEASFEKALGELVFGAYVGLARQAQAANHVRVDAMRKLAALGGEGRERAMVQRVLILALGDQEPLVRER
ncbi:MAG: HEAT repeat domain-containing protein, partial [Myxococcota bacterium]